MKTNKILPLVAAVLVTGGCSNDKVILGDVTGQAITFRVQDDVPSSRAATTTAGQVNAFVVNAQANDAVPAAERTVFDAVTVSRKEGAANTANSFDYSPKRYYPDAATKVAFSAYSPVSSHIGAGFAGNSTNAVSYTVPAPLASGSASQEDLPVAHTVTERQAVNEQFPAAVALQFRHALSRIYVKAANSLTEPVRITGLALHNLYTSGALDVDGDTWKTPGDGTVDINEGYQAVDNTDKYKVLWTPSGPRNGRYDYTLPEADATIPARSFSPVMLVSKDMGMFVLPQTTLNTDDATQVGAGDFYPSVAFEVSNYDDELRIPFSDLYGLGGGLTFEMGRTYALTLSFAESDGLINVRFQIEVEGWEEPPATQFLLAFDANGGGGAATEDRMLWEASTPYTIVAPNNPYYGAPEVYYC